MSQLKYPNGEYRFGGFVIYVHHQSEGGTGLRRVVDLLDDVVGEYEFLVDAAQMAAFGRKLGIAPELLTFWFLAHAAAEIIVQQVLPKSGDVAINADTMLRLYLDREDDDADMVFGKLMAIELTAPILFRLVGRGYDSEGTDRARQAALIKLKDKGIEVEPLTPGRRTRVLGAWGEKVHSTFQQIFGPWLHEKMGAPTGLPMQPA